MLALETFVAKCRKTLYIYYVSILFVGKCTFGLQYIASSCLMNFIAFCLLRLFKPLQYLWYRYDALFFLSVYWQYSACVCYMAGGLLLFIPLLLLLRVDPVVTKKEWSEHFISQAIMIYRWFVKCTSKYIAILKLTALHRNAYFVHLPQESHHNTYKPECQEKECSVQDNLLPPHRRPTRARVRTLSLVHPSLALVSIIIAPPPF